MAEALRWSTSLSHLVSKFRVSNIIPLTPPPINTPLECSIAEWMGKTRSSSEIGELWKRVAASDAKASKDAKREEKADSKQNPHSARKAVFLLSWFVLDSVEAILTQIQRHGLTDVLVGCSLSERGQTQCRDSSSGNSQTQSLFADAAARLSSGGHATVRVVHVPLSAGCISEGVFTIPARRQAFPVLLRDLIAPAGPSRSDHSSSKAAGATSEQAGGGSRSSGASEGTDANKARALGVARLLPSLRAGGLPKYRSVPLLALAHDLASLCLQLRPGVKPSCFASGDTSALLASSVLEAWTGANGGAVNKAPGVQGKGLSLVLIDRTMDMASPSSFRSDTWADAIIRGGSRNRAACLAQGQEAGGPGADGKSADEWTAFVRAAVSSDKKTAGLAARSLLHATLSASKVKAKNLKRGGVVTARELRRGLAQLDDYGHSCFAHRVDALEALASAMEAVRGSSAARVRKLASLEKVILQTARVTDLRPGIVSQLAEAVAVLTAPKGAGLPAALCLCALAFSLAGPGVPYSPSDLELLTKAIASALQTTSEAKGKTTSGGEGADLGPGSRPTGAAHALRISADIVERLRDVGEARARVSSQTLRDLCADVVRAGLEAPRSTGRGEALPSFMARLASRAFDPALTLEESDLSLVAEAKAAGMASLKNLGSWLGLGAKASSASKVTDQPLAIVFVVGGATLAEAYRIREAVAGAWGARGRVLFGATDIATQASILNRLFVFSGR